MQSVQLLHPINPPGIFTDERGTLIESWRVGKGVKPARCGLTSINKKGILRGMHYQRNNPRALVVRSVVGIIWDVALDLRKDSPTLHRTFTHRLTASGGEAVSIPAGFAHGFYAITDAVVIYECSDFYDKESAGTVLWNDPVIAGAWSGIISDTQMVMTSKDDNEAPLLANTLPLEV